MPGSDSIRVALEAYLYARSHLRLPDLHVADLDTWADTHLHLKGIVGGVDYNAIATATTRSRS